MGEGPVLVELEEHPQHRQELHLILPIFLLLELLQHILEVRVIQLAATGPIATVHLSTGRGMAAGPGRCQPGCGLQGCA